MPYLIGFAGLLAILGTGVYVFNARWKAAMMEKALDRTERYIELYVQKYLDSQQTLDFANMKVGLDQVKLIRDGEMAHLIGSSNIPDIAAQSRS
jgi:hypothetical protein